MATSTPEPDIAYSIRVLNGVSPDTRKWLRWRNDHTVRLYDNNASDSELWVFQKLSDAGVYHIFAKDAGLSHRYLSCRADGTLVDLFDHDDNSGRQRWKLEPEADYFHIRVAGGAAGMLSCPSDGSKLDLFPTDDSSGRQRWVLVPDLRFLSIRYDLEMAQAVPQDTWTKETTFENDTEVTQSYVATWKHKVTETKSLELTEGQTLGLGLDVSVGYPSYGSAGFSIDYTQTRTLTVGQVSSETTEQSYELPVVAAPHTTVVAHALVQMYELRVPFTMFFEGTSITGFAVGQAASKVQYSIDVTPHGGNGTTPPVPPHTDDQREEDRLLEEYRKGIPSYRYSVRTEPRTYLANEVSVRPHNANDPRVLEIEMEDAWVWDESSSNRYLGGVTVLTRSDVAFEDRAGYVANRRSMELHEISCVWASRIEPKNRVRVVDLAEATTAGFNGCRYCLQDLDTDGSSPEKSANVSA